MKSDRNIVFLGMMGSGKTSIGFLVSKKLKLDFYDVDHYIENKLKMKISNIFKNKGEKFFREYEEKITLELMKIKGIVVSLGGGAFLNKNIRNEVLKNHISFWLKTKDDILIQRIRKSAKRPLAYNVSNSDLQNMIKNRNKYYAKAQNKIDCHNKTKKEIVDKQNENDKNYEKMSDNYEKSIAFKTACDLIFKGKEQPSGYTEPLLHLNRILKKSNQN